LRVALAARGGRAAAFFYQNHFAKGAFGAQRGHELFLFGVLTLEKDFYVTPRDDVDSIARFALLENEFPCHVVNFFADHQH